MTRQALDTLWLTLENGAGETTRMGVTSGHPLFVAGAGWVLAGELVPGDAIRSSDLRAMRVLTVEMDATPQLAYNMEVAEAHTYFAGELEAWGHNAGVGHNGGPPLDPFDYARDPGDLCEQLALEEVMANPGLGEDTGISLGDPRIPEGSKKMQYVKRRSCGKKTVIHFVLNKFGIGGDFKFKNR